MSTVVPDFCVYRYYDAADRLLYVGVTWNPGDRLAQHRHKPWHADVVREERTWFHHRMDAFMAERHVTRTQAPLYASDVESSKATNLAIAIVRSDMKRHGRLDSQTAVQRARAIVLTSGYDDGLDLALETGMPDDDREQLLMQSMHDWLQKAADVLFGNDAPEAHARAS